MNDDQNKTGPQDADTTPDTENIKFDASPETETDNMQEDAETAGFPEMDENMLGQVQEMMDKLQRAEDLEKENADLKLKLGRLASDFEGYRTRTQQDVAAAQGQGVSKAAEALMPVYDDLDRALSMGGEDPAKLIPGIQAVQSKVLSVFAGLGLEATGREGEVFDPQWHEAIQVVPGDEDDLIVTVYQLGFRMGDRLVRPARVVVSRKG
ncbi:nucleotide exchange factor GrpE [Methylobacterium radiotolerans]|jgi:molecular chaperone GrpE|nr:nucleotide exchange factor GrpE [Deinococcus enclensis]PJI53003.1 nucleotide exchange factor GrpE [Methylobacterium radiotolerans]